MKRTGIRRKSWISRGKKPLKSGKPLARKTRLKACGKSMFPHKRHPKFMAWMYRKMKEGPRECGRLRTLALDGAVSSGREGKRRVGSLGNVVLMCDGPGDTCHPSSGKGYGAFLRTIRRGDLYENARGYEHEFIDAASGTTAAG